MPDFDSLIPALKTIMREAGKAILEVYDAAGPIEVSNKSDDSPVTKADHAAHIIIERGLKALTPDIPILSEEGGLPDFEQRSSWQLYWLVDPLDGTKEFINKNGEFTVNIALIDRHRPVLGLVYVPVKNIMYYGAENLGAYKEQEGKINAIEARPVSFESDLNVVGSRRHGAEALDKLLEIISPKFKSVDLVSMGSSLKICALAEGSADWYPRLALTSEWDTAAAHAVLNAAGGQIVDDQLKELTYNRKDSLLNPFFHAFGDRNFEWSTLISMAETRQSE